jgi:hypothetical protein
MDLMIWFKGRITAVIEKMANGQDGVMVKHAGTGKAHHSPDSGSHFRFIAVDGAFSAGGLAFLKGAFLKTNESIIQHFLAFRAERPAAVLLATVEINHYGECTGFLFHPRM